MTDNRAKALALLQEMIPGMLTEGDTPKVAAQGFAAEIGELSLDNVFGALWSRPGLDRRSRSILTIGILIALGATEELKVHFPIALVNGVTREELEEIVYHSAGYAGYPAASTARLAGMEVLDSEDAAQDHLRRLTGNGEKTTG
ncbi:carboxymuconolactone decarboxylase family protein [Saccharopolyspora gloriosae]|uniref:carboxymuconolactone decarboxylase family protein n=1 Tax=Saccharopolyspora gloriosae TaxID=455344 RepID=UPI001FB721CD|nr:carboxymuconolactone decarboxylase family protein [Saccharopolyspora gloriosae]